MLSLMYEPMIRGAYVRRTLPVIPWAMLRVRNEHSRAFRGRFSPESNPLGVEITEAQYWPHVRSLDVIAPPQWGKTFFACELPTLYDLVEARETVFYMNGSADNALNIWSTRWLHTLRADPVLRRQFLERMEAGRWDERHFADGGLLYSAGPESASALSQRESRIVRCSELEKTKSAIGDEASSYNLAKDRAAAYPATQIVTSDCTVTVREGLSWKRFVQGDRSRPFIPCPSCGHYAVPAHAKHLDDPDLGLNAENTHSLEIPEIASTIPQAAEEQAVLVCRKCGIVISDRSLRLAIRAGVWVPLGCCVVRRDNPARTPLPAVTWLDDLNRWVNLQLADADIAEGQQDPADPPKWSGPRLPDGVEIHWNADTSSASSVPAAEMLPAFRPDPRRASGRSFWAWRIFAPKYKIGQVARELVAGEIGELDDQKNASQKCLVLPWLEPIIGSSEDLNEDAVIAAISDLPRGIAPAKTTALTAGVDIGENELHWVLRAWTSENESFLVDHGVENTDLRAMRKSQGLSWNPEDPAFVATRQQAVYAALDRIWKRLEPGIQNEDGKHVPLNLLYVDAGYMSDEIYVWCGSKSFGRVRPSKGFGSGSRLGRRRAGNLAGQWTDGCEKKALGSIDGRGRPLKHQYYDLKDPRRLMVLDSDHWKREVHNAIRVTALHRRVNSALRDPAVKPYWFIHADLAPRPGRPRDRYIAQVVAERWEEWVNPRTQKRETGWREYQGANHLLDAECYAMAAAAAYGVDIGGRRPAPAKPLAPAPRQDEFKAQSIRRRY